MEVKRNFLLCRAMVEMRNTHVVPGTCRLGGWVHITSIQLNVFCMGFYEIQCSQLPSGVIRLVASKKKYNNKSGVGDTADVL